MKHFLKKRVLVILLGFFFPLQLAAEQPNILFIFADDQCFETVGAFGLTDIDTPHLDRLVERGTTFTQTYNMGSWSGAVCVASRHMLNTGAFLWRAEKLSENLKAKPAYPDLPNVESEGEMWSQLMAKAGYDTYFTGKWHVRADAAKIFEVARNIRGGMPKQTEAGYNRPLADGTDPWSPVDPKFGGFWEGGKHWSEVVADDAVSFLSEAKEKEDPFFMYIAFNAPHDPRQAPQADIDLYPLDRIELPENFLPEYPWNEQMKSGRKLRDERLAPFPRSEHAIKVNRQEYYAIITHMDREIGRILDQLEATGQSENTYIFFTADHGLAVGRHGLLGKQNLFDHSVRVPMMVVGPDVEAGATNSSPVYLQDVMPTTLELANATIPDRVEFQSLLPVLAGESPGYEAIYGAYLEGQRSIVKEGFKLILYPGVPKALLFDLESDPFEMTDVLSSNSKRAQGLFSDLLALQQEMDDDLDLLTPFPELSE